MNSMTNNIVHRVMVALTDITRKSMATMNQEYSQENDLKILDNSSLLLRIESKKENKGVGQKEFGADGESRDGPKGSPLAKMGESPRYYRHLEFDSIGYEHEPHLRSELNNLIEQTFRQQRNGCFLRLTPLRTHNLNLLTRLLVGEVDKMMLVLHYRLKAINLDYYDVRKFDMVNMLRETPPLVNEASDSRRRQVAQRGRTLQSTRELSQWLLSEYSALRKSGTGDDFIDLQYVYRDGQQTLHKLQLTVFQIYGCDNRLDISAFFSGLPTSRNSHATLLTDCIKESFDFKRPMRTLILFELPLAPGKHAPKWNRKILKLADTAYTSIRTSYRNCDDNETDKRAKNRPPRLPIPSETNLSLSSLSCKSLTHCLRRQALNLSKKDYNSLAYWYGRIDFKFRELHLSMERDYKLLYEQKSLQICNNLKSMSDDVSNIDDECGGDTMERVRKLEKFASSNKNAMPASQYPDLLKQFRQMKNEAAKSSFASTLMVYISTKNYELTEAAKALKQREVENLRQTLIKYIKNEGAVGIDQNQ